MSGSSPDLFLRNERGIEESTGGTVAQESDI